MTSHSRRVNSRMGLVCFSPINTMHLPSYHQLDRATWCKRLLLFRSSYATRA
jgi:hypothetical protein